MKATRVLAVLGALLLSACGDGSIQSPAFTAELQSLSVYEKGDARNTTVTPPVGRQVQLEAEGAFNSPPPNENALDIRVISVNWSSDTPSVATVDGDGKLTAVAVGQATITGAKDGKKDTLTVLVQPAALDTLTIIREPDTSQTAITADSIPVGAQRQYRALGIYSDGSKRAVPSSWTTEDPATATFPLTPADPTSVKVVRVPQAATPGATTDITATAAIDASKSAVLAITAVDIQLDALTAMSFDPESPIPINSSTQATVTGTYTDGSTATISADQLDWTPTTNAVADVNDEGLVTSHAEGTVAIRATLKDGLESQITDPARRMATGNLTVTGSACTAPLRSPRYTATGSTSGICIGCGVSNASSVTDTNDANSASLNIPVGLLIGGVTLDINTGDGTTITPSGPVGFIVGRPAGTLLAAELLSQVTLSTISATGEEIESSGSTNLLVLDLLGFTLIPGAVTDQAALSFTPTMPFSGLRLDYSAGVLTALSSLDVYNACGAIASPSTP